MASLAPSVRAGKSASAEGFRAPLAPNANPPRASLPVSEWSNRVPQSFLDARKNPISPRLKLMTLILEGLCRARCYWGHASERKKLHAKTR